MEKKRLRVSREQGNLIDRDYIASVFAYNLPNHPVSY